jgi:hypothetical protein
MRSFIPLLVFLLLLIPSVLALESCEDRKICFNTEQQNCLFLMFLPYDLLIIVTGIILYFVFREEIKHHSLKKKFVWGLSAFLIFVLLAFIIGKLFVFQRCGV